MTSTTTHTIQPHIGADENKSSCCVTVTPHMQEMKSHKESDVFSSTGKIFAKTSQHVKPVDTWQPLASSLPAPSSPFPPSLSLFRLRRHRLGLALVHACISSQIKISYDSGWVGGQYCQTEWLEAMVTNNSMTCISFNSFGMLQKLKTKPNNS